MASLTMPDSPAGADIQPSGPQVSSSQPCMISNWRPSPAGGTTIRTRTGNRCSAWRCARVDVRVTLTSVHDLFGTLHDRSDAVEIAYTLIAPEGERHECGADPDRCAPRRGRVPDPRRARGIAAESAQAGPVGGPRNGGDLRLLPS